MTLATIIPDFAIAFVAEQEQNPAARFQNLMESLPGSEEAVKAVD